MLNPELLLVEITWRVPIKLLNFIIIGPIQICPRLQVSFGPASSPSFELGSDFLKPNGILWLVSVGTLLNLPNTSHLHKLWNDGLVSKDMFSKNLRTYKTLQLRYSCRITKYFPCFSLSHGLQITSTNTMARIEVELGDHSLVEQLTFKSMPMSVFMSLKMKNENNLDSKSCAFLP